MSSMSRYLAPFLFLLLASFSVCVQASLAEESSKGVAFTDIPQLQAGFRLLYEQKFPEARQTFVGWEEEHPDDPFGEAAVAASYLFEEFCRQGVLMSDFFLKDKKLVSGIDGKPDPLRMKGFYGALSRTREIARARLRNIRMTRKPSFL